MMRTHLTFDFKHLTRWLRSARVSVLRPRSPERGFILTYALLIFTTLSIIALAVSQFALRHYVSARRDMVALSALNVAEAGADEFMYNVNQNTNYAGSGGDVTFFNDAIRGKGTYNTTVVNGSLNNEKVVTSTGKIYLPATAATPTVTRQIRITIRGIEPFTYAIQGGGSGPIYMYGNTNIAGSKIFTSTYLRIQDNSVSLNNDTLLSADKDPTSGYSTWNCSITGNNNPTNSTIKVRYNVNNSHCGIDTSTDTVSQNDASVTPQPLPTVDKSGILAGISGNTLCSDVTNTPYHIKNTNYQNANGSACNVTLDKSKSYTLDGSTYIKGNLDIESDTITPASGLSSDVYVIVDGTITIHGNSTSVTSNANNIAVIFVSYSSVDSGGDKTQPDAFAISGNSASLVCKMLALNGSLGMKGRGTYGPVAANSIVIDATGTVTFTSLAGVPADPSVWDVRFYQQVPY